MGNFQYKHPANLRLFLIFKDKVVKFATFSSALCFFREKEKKRLAHLGATENDRKINKKLKNNKWAKIYYIRLKFYEFLH